MTPEYVRYLHCRRWSRKRRGALRRARYRCERCGARRRLDVHHLTYKHIFHERKRELEVLCRPCHRKEHGR